MQISEFEKKRAANLIWNGAQDYTVETGFRVYDDEGRADVYWNSVLGAAHHRYDWAKLENFYQTFHETIDQGVYESLFWLAVENATYGAEKENRPVFPYLRKEYAKRQVDRLHGQYSLEDSAGQRLLAVTLGHFRRAIGEADGLPDLVDVKLLDAIEVDPSLDTDAFIAQVSKTLSTYFTYREPGADAKEKKPFLIPSLSALLALRKGGKKSKDMAPIRKLSFGYGEHLNEYGSEILDQSHLSVAFAAYTAQTDEGMREYIKNSFGKPLYSDPELVRMQKDYCYGNHTDVKLYFTDGSYTDEMLEQGYAGKMKKEGIAQAKKNEQVYESNGGVHRTQIVKLTNRIRNALQTHMEESQVHAQTGMIDADRIWRGLYLSEDKIFKKILPGDDGDLTVDIVLDASTSQLHRQETVAAQGYMIAEALTRCGIPTRVTSFCSLNGYTVVNVFRDYGAVQDNRNIFRFFTTGANRDGLAIRLCAGNMKTNHATHRLMIVLSDCRPNDVLKVRTSSGTYEDYAADLAIEDTAAEVHAARMAGIKVFGVYTGEDENISAAQKIYGHDFARIHNLEQFADAVGTLIQNQIATL